MRKCYLMDDEVVVSIDILSQRQLAFQSMAEHMKVKPGTKQAKVFSSQFAKKFVLERVEHEKAIHPDEASLPSVRECLVESISHCCSMCRQINQDQGCLEECDEVARWRKALEVEART